MKKIKLGNNKFTIVDDNMFEYLSQWKWSFDGEYARRREKGVKIYLHRVINQTPSNKLTDHVNRNKLDNRKINLRNADSVLNIRNSSVRNTNKSGYKGIWFFKQRNKWEVSITVNYKKIHIGLFKDIKEAILARKEAERIYWV